MGTLLPVKGIAFLISAFKEIKERNIKLSIYGKLFPFTGFESYPNLLKKMVKNDDRIEFMGGYDNKNIGQILPNIDVLIVPSLWLENAPLVIQEAFLTKTPVIASRIGGIPELVNDGLNGLLFNPGDAGDLREKIRCIIANPDIIEKFKGHIPKVKSIEDNAKQIEEIYTGLVFKKN
jgi:glycosyltransferase involved in cell wall biosynthesis